MSLFYSVTSVVPDVKQPTATPEIGYSDELNKLLCAAVVNRRFCRRLLFAPLAAVAEGYDGYMFSLAERELEALALINAATLTEFAQQLLQLLMTLDTACNECAHAAHRPL